METRKRWIRCFAALVLVGSVTYPISVSSQSIEDGWKGIRSLRSTKVEVDKILGKPEVDDNGYHGYRTEDAFVQVNYSTEPCAENQYNRGRFDIPSQTVLEYWVHPKELIKFTDFSFDKKKYYRESDDHMPNIEYYRNTGDGVWFSVEVLDSNGT